MLKNQNIVCISSIDWDFLWQGHQEIMASLAKSGNRVLFIENTGIRAPNLEDIERLKKRVLNWFRSIKGFRKEMENLYVYSPVILPFPYSKIARWIDKYMLIIPIKRWMKVMEFRDPIVWTFLPTGIALDIINNVDRKLLVYYCIADFYKLVGNLKKVKRTENELIRKSDLIFAQGKSLENKCRPLNDNVHVFPFGVKIETFENFEYTPEKIPDGVKDIKRPIIGYVGGVHRHIDFALIRFIAEAHPEWSIVLIGPVQTDISEIDGLQNIFSLGQKDFPDLPKYINQFDAAIIPYDINGYTATVFPTKLNEYHAMGKPVISTDLPEVVKFNAENDNLILVGKTYKDFTDHISRALKNRNDELIRLRKASAGRNSWTVRIGKMSRLLEDALDRKTKGPLDWQESLLRFYGTARRRMLKTGAIILATYLLMFYTPIIWFMANPLRISQVPKKADCIVVFAGGVGESGQAGQGYEERVQHAVELYKEGYAKYMIFSSGYMYAFKEPLVMKVLAISLGVPEEAIILEDKAKNTYENIKFTKKILVDKGWDEILLVSSPYHMRRISLVAKKLTRGTKIIYTPIPESRFYKHGIGPNGERVWKQVNLQQIRGLIHEYLAIMHYFIKGYI
ncbi:MAG: YdcF family protein [Candidatus Omnitrophica bacterium]|nr:YdcF family protein [Candidatus Omnitrophota bacterium]